MLGGEVKQSFIIYRHKIVLQFRSNRMTNDGRFQPPSVYKSNKTEECSHFVNVSHVQFLMHISPTMEANKHAVGTFPSDLAAELGCSMIVRVIDA